MPMNWSVQIRGGAVVIEMRSNAVNKMNPEFFEDLREALDLVEERHPQLPAVITASGTTFSAGLDFEDVFPRFASADPGKVMPWFQQFRKSILRVFTLPRRTVAAVNGNAFAGGLILASCCDVRIASTGESKFSLNEVLVGIPMPGVYTEILRYAVGSKVAAECILGGRVYGVSQAFDLGFFHHVVPAEQLLDEAVKYAEAISPDCFSAYAASKQALLRPTIQRIERDAREMDELALRAVLAPESIRAQRIAFERLKKRSSA
jgi:enoyl-CoA hydratase/carnithine racemase